MLLEHVEAEQVSHVTREWVSPNGYCWYNTTEVEEKRAKNQRNGGVGCTLQDMSECVYLHRSYSGYLGTSVTPSGASVNPYDLTLGVPK